MSDLGGLEEWAGRARAAQEAVNALGAGPPSAADDVLPGFEAEVVERDAIWGGKGTAPRMERQGHRDRPATRVLVRSDTSPEARGVTVHFTDAEWAVVERAVLAGLGLARSES